MVYKMEHLLCYDVFDDLMFHIKEAIRGREEEVRGTAITEA